MPGARNLVSGKRGSGIPGFQILEKCAKGPIRASPARAVCVSSLQTSQPYRDRSMLFAAGTPPRVTTLDRFG